jgi:hypothetical protein
MSKSGLFAVPRQYPRGEGLYNREKAIPKNQITRPLRRDAMRARVNTVITHAGHSTVFERKPDQRRHFRAVPAAIFYRRAFYRHASAAYFTDALGTL